MQSTASAIWRGGLKDGRGELTSKSGTLKNTPYDFKMRFEGSEGTNPEELIAAAHAGCFSMALSKILGEQNLKADEIRTTATVHLESQGSGFAITRVQLTVQASIPGAADSDFEQAAQKAKEGCPVSKLLKAEISMTAQLTR